MNASEANELDEARVQADDGFDYTLDTEVLTEKTPTKTVPCRKCRRPCVVTLFATSSKVECSSCRGKTKTEHKERVQAEAARTVNPANLENLRDALVNPAFRQMPLCPFDAEHEVVLKAVTHSPNYGPRHLVGYDGKGIPRYEQDTGETVTYQCTECKCVISYSTQHPMELMAQNEARAVDRTGPGFLESMLGIKPDASAASGPDG